jgi:hypothetical protein
MAPTESKREARRRSRCFALFRAMGGVPGQKRQCPGTVAERGADGGGLMRARKDTGFESLEIRALYSIAELARAAGVTTYMLRRALRAAGVDLLRSGRALYVPLSEIESKIPSLWQSIRRAEQVRRSAKRGVALRGSLAGPPGRS